MKDDMEQIQMVHVDVLHPHEQNPRLDAASVSDLVESIRQHGVEVPLVAAPEREGGEGYVVLAGHRRLTAAHALGLDEVPVQVRDDLTDARDQLAFMATENILRDQLSAVEEARLVQDMLDLGMSQAEVAKQTALGKERVRERVKLTKLAEGAGEKVHRGQISVDDALIIAEYSDDPETAELLEGSAGTPNFDWQVSRARRAREDRERVEQARKDAKKRGLRVVESVAMLSELVRDGLFVTDAIRGHAGDDTTDDAWAELLISEHASCPGHAASILTRSQWVTGHGNMPAGTLVIGCDQHEALHGATDVPEDEESEEEPDPWDEIPADDFATAKVHRERHLAAALPTLDVTDEAVSLLAARLVEQGWGYSENEPSIDLLQAITGHEGKSRVERALRRFPLSTLVWLEHNWWELRSHHKYMGEGRQGSSYWGRQGELRQLLERTGYAWSETEQQAILLATGVPHDAPADDEAAEGGEEA